MPNKCLALVLVSILLFFAAACAEQSYLKAKPENLEWFRNARYGLFIHWGPVSITGQEISHSRGGVRPGFPKGEHPFWGKLYNEDRIGVPVEIYDNLYKKFNPEKFNAKEWMKIIKDAGMKYIIFVTKHHDGFCMFDTQYTDYNIMNTPYGKDICKEIADACHETGIKLCWYYSQPDWYRLDFEKDPAKHREYVHNQVLELLTNYGKVDVMWFDGLTSTAEDWDAPRLFKMIRQLQPDILINDRCGLPADFQTPEQEVGKFMNNRPWESCVSMGREFCWKTHDTYKTAKEGFDFLMQCAGGDGNLAYGIGPMPDGRINPQQVERLKIVGDWLKKYGESVYGTRGGPFRPTPQKVSTYHDNKIYVHVLDWVGNDVGFPAIDAKIISSKLLTGGGPIDVKQADGELTISVPAEYRNELDTVIVLEIDKPVGQVKSVKEVPISLNKPSEATGYWNHKEEFTPSHAFDGDLETRWASGISDYKCSITVDLGEPFTIGRAVIHEAKSSRVKQFILQYKYDDSSCWEIALAGTKLDRKEFEFNAVRGRYFRLNILDSDRSPTIAEIELYPGSLAFK